MMVTSIVIIDSKDIAGAGEATWRRRRCHNRHGFFLQRLHQDIFQAAHVNEVYRQSLLAGGIEPARGVFLGHPQQLEGLPEL